ncbi:unnamed protein product, partial [Effrenium voratum]
MLWYVLVLQTVCSQWANSSLERLALDSQDIVLHQGRYYYNDTRRLQTIELSLQEDWDFPVGTRLQFQSFLDDQAFGSGAAAAVGISVLAGYKYSSVQIEMPDVYEFSIDHAEAVVKLVYSDATRGSCERSDYNVPMALTQNSSTGSSLGPSPLASGAVLRTPQGGTNVLYRLVEFPHLTFMKGGTFRLCYSPDGTFFGDEWKNNIVPVEITVLGVASDCLSDGCLANERWDCYFSYAGEDVASCRIDFRLYGGGREGWTVQLAGVSRVSWSEAWGDDSFFDGQFVPAPRKECSNVVSFEYINPETALFESFTWAPPDGSGLDADGSTAASLPR